MSFAEMLKTSRKELLYIVRGTDKGKPAWYCLLVDKMKHPLFAAYMKTKPDIIHLDEYGKVLYSGWGDNPPQDIIDELRATY